MKAILFFAAAFFLPFMHTSGQILDLKRDTTKTDDYIRLVKTDNFAEKPKLYSLTIRNGDKIRIEVSSFDAPVGMKIRMNTATGPSNLFSGTHSNAIKNRTYFDSTFASGGKAMIGISTPGGKSSAKYMLVTTITPREILAKAESPSFSEKSSFTYSYKKNGNESNLSAFVVKEYETMNSQDAMKILWATSKPPVKGTVTCYPASDVKNIVFNFSEGDKTLKDATSFIISETLLDELDQGEVGDEVIIGIDGKTKKFVIDNKLKAYSFIANGVKKVCPCISLKNSDDNSYLIINLDYGGIVSIKTPEYSAELKSLKQ